MLDMRNAENMDLMIFYSAVLKVSIVHYCQSAWLVYRNHNGFHFVGFGHFKDIFLYVRSDARVYIKQHGHLIGWCGY